MSRYGSSEISYEEVCESEEPSKSVLDEAAAQVDKVRQDARNRYEHHLDDAKRFEVLATEHRQAAQAWQSVFQAGPVDPISPMRDEPESDQPNLKSAGSW